MARILSMSCLLIWDFIIRWKITGRTYQLGAVQFWTLFGGEEEFAVLPIYGNQKISIR